MGPLLEGQGTGGSQGRVSLGVPGLALAGVRWGDHLVVRACSWLSASRHPLYQQLFQELLEGDVMLAWQGAPCAICSFQPSTVKGLSKCVLH